MKDIVGLESHGGGPWQHLLYHDIGMAGEMIRKAARIKTGCQLRLAPLWVPAWNCFYVFEPYSGMLLERPTNWLSRKTYYRRLSVFASDWEDAVKAALKSGQGKPGSTEKDRIALEEWVFGKEI